MLKLLSVEEALETCLLKGIEKDDINIIANGIRRDTPYKQALRTIVGGM